MKFQFSNLISLLVITAVLTPVYNFCATIGGSGTVSREAFVVFSGIDNEILDFAFMENGFALADSATTCTFDAAFPVKGDVSLNGGTLYLKSDLAFDNVSTFTSLGTVTANNLAVELASGMTTLGSGSDSVFTFENVDLILHSNIDLQDKLRFDGNSVIDGKGNILDLKSTASIIVGANATLTLKDVVLQGVNGTKIQCADSTGVLILQDVLWVQDADYTFDTGAIQFKNEVQMNSENTFVYSSAQTSTILANSKLELDFGFTFSYAPSISANNLLQLFDTTSLFVLLSSTLHATNVGLELTKGKFIVDGKSFLSSDASMPSKGISFGDGSDSSNNLSLEILPAAHLELLSGFLKHNNV